MRRRDNTEGEKDVSSGMGRIYVGLVLLVLGTTGCPQENLLITGTQSFGNSGGGTGSANLVFTVEPNSAVRTQIITPAIQVTVHDSLGNVDTAFTASITISINLNPTGGNLSGGTTQPPVRGVASFGDLSIDKAGNGYSLRAQATGASTTTSTGFNITP